MQINQDDIDKIINEQKSKATKQKTDASIRLLQQYLIRRGDNRKVENIPPQELDDILSLFFVSVRKTNGTEYEPSSLKSFQSSFQRYLKENNYKYDIINDRDFNKSNRVLASKQKEF